MIRSKSIVRIPSVNETLLTIVVDAPVPSMSDPKNELNSLLPIDSSSIIKLAKAGNYADAVNILKSAGVDVSDIRVPVPSNYIDVVKNALTKLLFKLFGLLNCCLI